MPRGGYRPGAGRPKGRKDKPKETAFTLKARELAEHYKALQDKARKGVKPTAAETQRMHTLSAELATALDDRLGGTEAELEDILPLDLMLRYMRDPREDKEFRVRLATAAAPYIHARKGEAGTGKKDQKADMAKEVASGEFSSAIVPLKRVK